MPALLRRLCILLGCVVVLLAADARADVIRVEVERRTPVLDGESMGPYGSYELIEGRIYFAVDPANPYNARVADLDLAPRDSLGRVVSWANFSVLQPVNREKRRGVGLVEVSNRGGKFTMGYFNRATAPLSADDPDAYGDRLLMKEGMTIIWVGWQWDVPRGEDRLRLRVPTARHPDGDVIHGRVRSDWVVDDTTDVLPLAHRDHFAYRAVDWEHPSHVLTVRTGRDAPRRVVPRDQWRYARRDSTGIVPDSTHIFMPGGFDTGRIYELVYRSKNPRVVGLGLTAIRDVISYAKYNPDALFPLERGIAVGVSQTGRFLRQFLYQGFNTDEEGRKAYDGVVAITAGAGRGSFNHRFGQPSRDAHRYSAFFYPTDIFPFTSQSQFDPETWSSDGMLVRQQASTRPKLFQINTGYEYWGRAASLIHTTPDGTEDVAPVADERIYHVAGAQHFPWRFPPPASNLQSVPDAALDTSRTAQTGLYRGNPLDQSVVYRALMLQMLSWVDRGTAPPPSAHPHPGDGTLVPLDDLDVPDAPGLTAPEVVHQAYRVDYGPRFRSEGIVDVQPPRLGDPFGVRVPQVDDAGNERGSVRTVEVEVPLATYLPWNLRGPERTNPGELTDFYGSFIPFPRTPQEKARLNDPRPAITSLYPSRDAYLGDVREAADRLIEQGFLLTDDRDRVLTRAAATWDWIFGRTE